MMKQLIVLAILTLGLAFAGEAWAQQGGDSGVVVDPIDGKTYAKKTTFDFEEDVIDGTLVKPEGDYLDSRQRRKQSSLIKVRTDFVPEMLKSAEGL